PNAGKSTLLAALTAARPKIADYPFTTLSPNLGVAGSERRMIVADVPGLIHGAHEGRGLGLDFLRHVSRCRVLAYVVHLSAPDPSGDLDLIRSGVPAYAPELASRRTLVVATNADLPASAPPPPDVDVVVSGTVGSGLDELEARLDQMIAEAKAAEPSPEAYVVVRPAREAFSVAREGPSRFRVSGSRVERWVAEADMD